MPGSNVLGSISPRQPIASRRANAGATKTCLSMRPASRLRLAAQARSVRLVVTGRAAGPAFAAQSHGSRWSPGKPIDIDPRIGKQTTSRRQSHFGPVGQAAIEQDVSRIGTDGFRWQRTVTIEEIRSQARPQTSAGGVQDVVRPLEP